MATLLLTAGAAVLTSGAAAWVTTAVGALATVVGGYIDARLFGPGGQKSEGPRLDSLQVQASTEGASIPEMAGRVRLAGQIIWATKFKKVGKTEKQGGKGGGGGVETTTIDVLGLGTSNTGTVVVVAPAAGNLFTQSIRNKITSAATAGSAATLRGAQLCLWRGNSAGLGGFYLCMRGGIETFQATCRIFMGLYSAAADIGNVNPSTLLNMVGIGFDSSQTTLRLRNDGSGTATAVDLASGLPTTGSQILYELILSAEPNGSDNRYRVERLNSGDLAEGILTSDLPVATQYLTPHFWLNNGTTAASVELAVVSLYAEPASLMGSRQLVL